MLMLMGSVAMHFAQMNDADKDSCERPAPCDAADEAFESSLWIPGRRLPHQGRRARRGDRSRGVRRRGPEPARRLPTLASEPVLALQ